MPLSWGRQMGLGLARIAVWVSPRQTRQARANLAIAYPELASVDRESILSECRKYLGRNLFHTLVAQRLLNQQGAVIEASDLDRKIQVIRERMQSLLAENKGILLLGGHLGCWELAGGWLAREIDDLDCGPLGVVTGTIHNPPINRMVQKWRRQMGMKTLPRDEGAAPLVKLAKDGGAVAILLDQQIEVSNLDTPFFGEMAPTPSAIAKISLKYSIPVLPVAAMWDNETQVHVMQHEPPIMPADFADGDLVGFLTACNSALESLIRRNPEQWVWFHQRWPAASENKDREAH